MIDEKKFIEELEKSLKRMIADEYGKHPVSLERIIDVLKDFPKVNEWIPCSERLPKRQDSENTFLKNYLVQTNRCVIHMGYRDEEGTWRTIHGNLIRNVIAWQPLPEPYKE